MSYKYHMMVAYVDQINTATLQEIAEWCDKAVRAYSQTNEAPASTPREIKEDKEAEDIRNAFSLLSTACLQMIKAAKGGIQ